MIKLKKYLRDDSYSSLRIALAFFAITAGVYCFSFFALPYYNFPASPDEKVAQLFTRQSNKLEPLYFGIPSDITKELAQYLPPRSMRYQPEYHGFRMSSYLGLPVLYGFASQIFTFRIIPCITFFICLMSVFLLLRFFQFSSRLSFLGSVVFGFNPFIVYYTLRGYMHNVFFLSLLLASFTLAAYSIRSRKVFLLTASGVLFGFSLAVRTNELVWSSGAALVFILFVTRNKRLQTVALYILGAVLGFLPFIALSRQISFSLVQYQAISVESFSSGQSLLQVVKNILLPFGFNFLTSLKRLYHFSYHIWWWTVPAVVSYVYVFFRAIKERKQKTQVALFLFFIGCLYLVLYYGPYAQEDPQDKVVISHSHFRYWMPLFLIIPFLFAKVVSHLSNKRAQKVVSYIVIACAGFSTFAYLLLTPSGLNDSRYQNILAYERNVQMKDLIPYDSVILAGRADKYFVRDWIVVAGTRMHTKREQFAHELIRTTNERPFYYYHVPADANSHKTKDALESAGVQFIYIKTLFEEEMLYQLNWPNK